MSADFDFNPDTKSAPIFTIVVPCWNSASTLRSTLNSVLAQDFLDWECIVIDDGSDDDTLKIIKLFCKIDSRISSVFTNRQGPSRARNLAGLSLAKGKYLAFLDSDDLWLPNKLSCTLAHFEDDQSIDGSYSQIAFFSLNPDKPETFSTVYKLHLQPIDFLRDNPVCTMSNLVIKKSVFIDCNGFDQTLVHNEDVEFLVRATAKGAVIGGVDRNLVQYRTSVTGLSSNLSAMRAGWYAALRTLQSTSYKLTAQQVADADAGNFRYLSRRALRTGAPGLEPLKLALKGIRRSPKSFFNPFRRGALTLLGAIISPCIPILFRRFTFSR
jgi:glycosyltransferase involved in cell wall biosynthesis